MQMTAVERDNITWAESAIRESYAPLQGGFTGFKTRFAGFTSGLGSKEVLLGQIEALQEKNNLLRRENQALYEYKAEALRLQRLIDFQNDNLETYTMLPVRVIARSPSTWYKFIVIDKGALSHFFAHIVGKLHECRRAYRALYGG